MKKCKFCGENGIIRKDGIAYYVQCLNCGARTFYAISEEEAINLWDDMMSEDRKEETENG